MGLGRFVAVTVACGLMISAMPVALADDEQVEVERTAPPATTQMWIDVESPGLAAGDVSVTIGSAETAMSQTPFGATAVVPTKAGNVDIKVRLQVKAEADVVVTFADPNGQVLDSSRKRLFFSGVDPTPVEIMNVFFADDWAQTIARHALKISSADQILAGDWDGDGIDTLALRTGNRYTFFAANQSDSDFVVISLGDATSLVVTGDFDGDGFDDVALRTADSKQFDFYYNVGGAISSTIGDSIMFGRVNDIPIAGDWNGDGKDTLGVHRERSFYLNNTLTGGIAEVVFMYGRLGDRALVGDFDADKTDTIALERGNDIYIRSTLTGGVADLHVYFGRTGDERFLGDWSGKGIDSLAAYRR